MLAGENVKNDGLAQLNNIAIGAGAVGDASVAADGEDRAFGILGAIHGQPQIDPFLNLANRKRGAVSHNQRFVFDFGAHS